MLNLHFFDRNLMDIEALRREFPELSETVYGKPLVYLDNAATSQRPLSVVNKWNEMSLKYNSNLHRAVHHIASVATDEFESTREAVKKYINTPADGEVVFTSGATASINLVAQCFSEAFLHPGDEIIVSEAEHHSNIVPWQMACKRSGAVIKVLHVDRNGHFDLSELEALITPSTKLACFCHISNVLGLEIPLKKMISICHSKNCLVLADGSQGIVHCRPDMTDLDCDFYVFSGHKVYAAPGTGVLYGKRSLLDSLPPYMGGGEMIATVSWDGTTYADVPHRFEAGTQNISGIPTLKPALEMAEMMSDPQISEQHRQLTDYVLDALVSDPRITLYGVPGEDYVKLPLFSFCVQGVHHEDLALILDKMGIAVRSGQMCAEPLMDRYGVTGMLRASFAPYNTLSEAEYFISSLDRAINMLI